MFKKLVKATKRVYAADNGSPTRLIRRTVKIIQNEGSSGLANRILIWLSHSEVQPSSNKEWTQIFKYRSAKQHSHNCAKTKPLSVSVIVPNYNHAAFLRKRLDSIYQQTYAHIQVILLDDASNDTSRDILKEYADKYPANTICIFNDHNSGGVFHQWVKGLDAAKGDLVWIAESDDYCTPDLLQKLVTCFQDEGVRIAFCRTEFVEEDSGETIWSTQSFLNELAPEIWNKKFIASANSLTKNAWGVRNVIPNVSSCVFRHPQNLTLLQDNQWKTMRLCGDWIFYLALARAGLVAYDPAPINYYRQHARNTSAPAQRESIYYKEHRIVQDYLQHYYKLSYQDLGRFKDSLYRHWCINNGFWRRKDFEKVFDCSNVTCNNKRTLNIVIATYALIAGGGETLPLMLANLIHNRGHAVTVVDFNLSPPDEEIRRILSPEVPLITLNSPFELQAIVDDMAIDIIHSHHAWVDMTIASLLKNSGCRHVVTLHGMYELMSTKLILSLRDNIEEVDCFVYTATKNLAPFSESLRSRKGFKRINNAVIAAPYAAQNRQELGIGEDDFVLCMVARGRADKGWHEAIQSVLLANSKSDRHIHLLLIGDGEEPQRLKPIYASEKLIHFLGFQGQFRSFMACSDMGFIPSRFPGESFPLVLIDSLMCGKPVLASSIGEIEQMLLTDDGLAGKVFSLQDWQISVPDLASDIITIANDVEEYNRMLARVKTAASKFNPERMADQYESVYYRLAGSSPKLHS